MHGNLVSIMDRKEKSNVSSNSMEVQTLHGYAMWCLWTLTVKDIYCDMFPASTFQTADCFEAMYRNHKQIFILQTAGAAGDGTILVVCHCHTVPVHTVLPIEGVC